MTSVLSVNLGTLRPLASADDGITGIDKRPATGPVRVVTPDTGGQSGLEGDRIATARHHGGPDQAVYAYAREDLDAWEHELGRPLRAGAFGENLTTSGVDCTGALIGERWLVGTEVVLEVSAPRIPCNTFAGWLDERAWVKRFTRQAVPGAYLRVIVPGTIAAGDPIAVIDRPGHDVTIGLTFQALTTRPELLPRLLAADALPDKAKRKVAARTAT
jgi:MOSC domain-containing protein YiiM